MPTTISFDSSLAGVTIILTQGQLELSGAGAGVITIDASSLTKPLSVSGNNAGRVFQVDSNVQASLSGLNVEDGNSGNNSGGGILNNGTLTVTDSTITANAAGGVGGGGIENSGTLTVTNTTISGNSTGLINGGIENFGTLIMSNTTVSDNSTPFNGGGLGNYGTATVAACTFSGNNVTQTATGEGGGGIAAFAGSLTVTNSTFFDNSVPNGSGGAIIIGVFGSSPQVAVTNTTITGNSAGDGGGIDNPVPFVLVNTIVAGNTAATAADVDGQGQAITGGHNLIGDAGGLSGTGISDGDANGDSVGHAALLGTFGNYGGPTQTIPLVPGSLAIGAGGPVTALSSAAGAGDTTIDVSDAAAISSTPGGYVIQIDSEQIEVTNVDLANNILTVMRGVNGTTAAAHDANANVTFATDQRGYVPAVPPDIGACQLTSAGTATGTVYWTGDAGDNDWDNAGNWSNQDPLINNVAEPLLPGPASTVVVDLSNQTINHAQNVADTIASLTVTGGSDTLNLSAGSLDLSGSGSTGAFQVDQPGDASAWQAARSRTLW